MNARLLASRALKRLVRLSVISKPYTLVSNSSISANHCAHQQLQCRTVQTKGVDKRLPPANQYLLCERYDMASSVTLHERDVRQVVTAALRSALAVPQHHWSEEFVTESVLGDLIVSSISSDGTESLSNTAAASSTSSDSDCEGTGSVRDAPSSRSSNRYNKRSGRISSRVSPRVDPAAALIDVNLGPDIADALDVFMAAGEVAAATSQAKPHTTSRHKRRNSEEDDQQQQQQQQQEVLEGLQARFSHLLYENYQQVEDEEVLAFCHKLVIDLQHLVQAAAADQADDQQGLCALCGRDMPLTKHHLIPRDVHKEFKKRGFGFDQLQSGLLVCRPCHSAVHRAVPDNRELATHYRTLEDLRQHEAIAKFSAWASKQRVSSKVDATAKHFRYRK